MLLVIASAGFGHRYKGPGLDQAEYLIHMSAKVISYTQPALSLTRINLVPLWGDLTVASKVFRIGLKSHKVFLQIVPTASHALLKYCCLKDLERNNTF